MTETPDRYYIGWEAGCAEIKSFSTASSPAGSLVKIEMLITDAYTFARVSEALHEQRTASSAKKTKRAP